MGEVYIFRGFTGLEVGVFVISERVLAAIWGGDETGADIIGEESGYQG